MEFIGNYAKYGLTPYRYDMLVVTNKESVSDGRQTLRDRREFYSCDGVLTDDYFATVDDVDALFEKFYVVGIRISKYTYSVESVHI